jgi:hypothetical protein
MDTGASQPIRIKLGFIYSYIFASMLASSEPDPCSKLDLDLLLKLQA